VTRSGTTGLILLLAVTLSSCGGDPAGPGTFGVLTIADGDRQSAPISAPLPMPLTVKASDRGGPLPGRMIRWRLVSAPGADARLADSMSATDEAGLASMSLVLGSVAGDYVVRATTEGGAVDFTATARAVVRSVQPRSGNGQVGMTGATLPQPIVAALTSDGVPAPNISLAFEVVEGDASVSPATATTDATGTASTTLTLGSRRGPVKVAVSDGLDTAEFEAWACGGDEAAGFVELAVSADTAIAGEDLGCIQFDGQEAGAAYEAVVVSANPSLGFDTLSIYVRGAAAPGSTVQAPGPVGASPSHVAGWSAGGAIRPTGSRLGPQYALDRRLRELEAPLRPLIRQRARQGGFALAALPTVGDLLTYRFACGGPIVSPRREVTGMVLAIGSKSIIVEDTAVSTHFTAQEAADIAANFDEIIFTTDTTYFGAPADIDGNGRVILLFTAAVNEMADANPGGYDDGIVAGFFCPVDLGFNGGNSAEMFYLVAPDPTGEFTDAPDLGLGKEEVLTFVNGTVAHEFQHLVNAQTGSGGAFDVWLNEGLSHLAEEVVGHAATGFTPGSDLTLSNYDAVSDGIHLFNTYHVGNWFNLHEYLEAPSDTAGLVMTSDPLGTRTFRMRGAAWSFLRYLLDRFETKAGEPAATRALVRNGSADSRDAVEAVFGQPFGDLVADWSAMLMLDDRNPLAPRPDLALASYRLRQMYAELGSRSTSFPDDGVPLPYAQRRLDGDGGLTLDLYSYTAAYVRFEAPAGSAGTGVRFGRPSTAADLPTSADVRVRIVRIR
jgi:hypothetical protein